MDDHLVRALSEIIGTAGTLVVALFTLVLAVLLIFLPFFVFRIMKDVGAVNRKMDKILTRLDRLE